VSEGRRRVYRIRRDGLAPLAKWLERHSSPWRIFFQPCEGQRSM